MNIPIEQLYDRVGSLYKLVTLATQRALELNEGAPKLVEGGAKEKPSIIALREIAQGKVSATVKKQRKE